MGFPGSSASKESTCNTGDPGLVPGSGRSPGEGIGYPFQYSWVSFVAQLVNNPPAIQETWGLIPGFGRSPGKGKGYPLQYFGLENYIDCIVHGVSKSQTRLSDFHFHFSLAIVPQKKILRGKCLGGRYGHLACSFESVL